MSSHYPAGSSLQDQAASLVTKIRRKTNQELKDILGAEGLHKTGVKNILQTRIADQINRCVRENDREGISRIAYEIDNNGQTPPLSSYAYSLPISSSPPLPSYNMANGYSVASHNTQTPRGPDSYHCPITYKESPFYEILEPLTPPLEIRSTSSESSVNPKKLETNREALPLNLSLSPSRVDGLRADNALRLMLYCATEPKFDHSPSAPRNIAFPHNLDIKINGEEFKANFRGLKNKPGSTKPADITSFVRTKVPGYKNQITVTYALTKEKYIMNVMLVRKHTVAELTEKIRKGQFISKTQVLNEMKSSAKDSEIVAVSTVLSLKDPISYLRLNLPCRSTTCAHMQCFDVNFFLELQEQAPQWACPVCSKPIPFKTLAVDQYMQEILQQTSTSTEQVTVEPDGQWTPTVSESSDKPGMKDDDDDSDELVEVSGFQGSGNFLKTETPATPFSFSKTPPVPSPALSMRNQSNGGAGSKRRSEVIDLTLSDDDEPPPKRPAPNPGYSNNANGFRSSSNSVNGGLQRQSNACFSTPGNGNSSFATFSIGNPSTSRSSNSIPSRSGLTIGHHHLPTPPGLAGQATGSATRTPSQLAWGRSSSSSFEGSGGR